jgi:hypothetical protein
MRTSSLRNLSQPGGLLQSLNDVKWQNCEVLDVVFPWFFSFLAECVDANAENCALGAADLRDFSTPEDTAGRGKF